MFQEIEDKESSIEEYRLELNEALKVRRNISYAFYFVSHHSFARSNCDCQ